MKNLVVVLLLAFGGLKVHAQGKPQLGDASDQLLKGLMDKGVVKIGDFDVAKFANDKKQIKWSLTTKELPFALTGDRRSAYFLVKDKKVFMASELPEYTSESLAGLEMHESFGALGYDDKSYVLSSTLKLLSNVKDKVQLQDLIKTYGKDIFNKAGLKDSGTSVGGGGDLVALTAKEKVLERLWKTRVPTKDFLIAYPKINFEPNYEEDQQEVSIYYEANHWDKTEKFGITIPALLFEKDEATRQAVIDEILAYVFSFFPAYPDAKTYTFTPYACQSNNPKKKITFPVPKNGIVRQIQEQRAGYLTGCDHLIAATIRYPYFQPKKFLYQGKIYERK